MPWYGHIPRVPLPAQNRRGEGCEEGFWEGVDWEVGSECDVNWVNKINSFKKLEEKATINLQIKYFYYFFKYDFQYSLLFILINYEV